MAYEVTEVTFYADENISKAIISGVRRRGVSIISTPEAKNLGISDEEHFKYAISNQYVLLTRDDDFLKLASLSEYHSGIAYARMGITVGQIVSTVLLISETMDRESVQNQIMYL